MYRTIRTRAYVGIDSRFLKKDRVWFDTLSPVNPGFRAQFGISTAYHVIIRVHSCCLKVTVVLIYICIMSDRGEIALTVDIQHHPQLEKTITQRLHWFGGPSWIYFPLS